MSDELIPVEPRRAPDGAWHVRGRATIDKRPGTPCILTVNADGTWAAQLSQFTLAGDFELFLESHDGGHFMGPATVARSRADSYPLAMTTDLVGTGPLLVVAPSITKPAPEVEGAEMVDGEVVGEG